MPTGIRNHAWNKYAWSLLLAIYRVWQLPRKCNEEPKVCIPLTISLCFLPYSMQNLKCSDFHIWYLNYLLFNYFLCRYLFVRWGIELSNMIVFVGESGDTDYEGLLGGVQKTVILKGAFNTAPSQVHSTRSYLLKDVVAFDSPNILQIEGCGTNDVQSALKQLGILKN